MTRPVSVRHTALLAALGAAVLGGCSDGAIATFNTLPSAAILSPEDGAVFLEGERIEFRGIAEDRRTSPERLVVSWSSSIDGQLHEGAADDANRTSFQTTRIQPGEHVITLRVVDPDGAPATDTVEITIHENQAPQLVLESPRADGVYHNDYPVPLRAIVGDFEDEPEELTVVWTADGRDPIEGDTPDSSGLSLGVVNLPMGAHTWRVTVTDTLGKTAAEEVTFDVLGPNHLPTCDLLAPDAGTTFIEGDLIPFRGTADDEDVPGNLLTVEWSSSLYGAFGSSIPTAAGDIVFESSALGPGPQTVTMTVFDEVGAPCSDRVDLVVSAPPDVTITSPPDGTSVRAGAPVSLEGRVIDFEEGTNLAPAAWWSNLDGNLGTSAISPSGAVVLSLPSLSRGTHTITLSATDSDGLTGQDSITLISNGTPSAPGPQLSPAIPVTTDDLVATIVVPSTDPENDPITYDYQWSKDGVLQPSYNGQPTLPAVATAKGQTWVVSVTASDGTSSSVPATASVTVVNSPPSILPPSITPAPLTAASTATCNAGATSDPDGDPVYRILDWSINGTMLGINAYTITGLFVAGDSIVCYTTPVDGQALGVQQASPAVVVSNSPPTQPTVTIDPVAATDEDDLLCLPTGSTDADGDIVTYEYEWAVDGVVTAYVDAELPASATMENETWTCTATPFDGTDYGPSASASVAVCDQGLWYQDNDGDGYGDFYTELVTCNPPLGYVDNGDDCNDNDPNVSPYAGDVAGDGSDPDCDGMDCDAGDHFGTYFVFCTQNGDWFDAETACTSGGYDGLASFLSASEETFVVNMLVASGNTSQKPWLGLTDQNSPGVFSWTDGSPLSYQNWDTGQPDSGGTGQDCAVLDISGGASAWDDRDCTFGSPGWTSYVCSDR